jgi:hypothetical protein
MLSIIGRKTTGCNALFLNFQKNFYEFKVSAAETVMKGYENLFILFTSFFTFSADFPKSLQQGKIRELSLERKRQVRDTRIEI